MFKVLAVEDDRELCRTVCAFLHANGYQAIGCLNANDAYDAMYANMFVGVPVGIVGMILVALAYPLYNRILKKERERIAPQILRLTEELMK